MRIKTQKNRKETDHKKFLKYEVAALITKFMQENSKKASETTTRNLNTPFNPCKKQLIGPMLCTKNVCHKV